MVEDEAQPWNTALVRVRPFASDGRALSLIYVMGSSYTLVYVSVCVCVWLVQQSVRSDAKERVECGNKV